VDVVDITLLVTRALERCGVAYFLGGSLASSFQGEPRATNDVDLVVDLPPDRVAAFVAALGPDFDVDADALSRAARERGSWNVIYVPAVTKIDLFVLREAPFDQAEFGRRRLIEVRPGASLFIKSPEDSVLRKLLWYRAGGGVSDRQWRDVVQVLRQSRAVLDDGYLDEWAARLALGELLARARAEAA
jgi:hypothetical protein